MQISLNMNSEEKVNSTILCSLCAGGVSKRLSTLTIKKKKKCNILLLYNDILASGGLPEQFRSNIKVHWSPSNALDSDIMAVQQELVDQDPNRPIRSLKINAEELKKVLKEVLKPWMDCIVDGLI